MQYTKDLNIEQMDVIFNGVLAVLSLIMIIFVGIILFKEVVGIFSYLYRENKIEKSDYKNGYEDGMKEGLSQAHKMVEQLLKEKQIKIDSTFDNEGDG